MFLRCFPLSACSSLFSLSWRIAERSRYILPQLQGNQADAPQMPSHTNRDSAFEPCEYGGFIIPTVACFNCSLLASCLKSHRLSDCFCRRRAKNHVCGGNRKHIRAHFNPMQLLLTDTFSVYHFLLLPTYCAWRQSEKPAVPQQGSNTMSAGRKSAKSQKAAWICLGVRMIP